MEFNIFGSPNSEDYDIVVPVDTLPDSKEKCKELCKNYEDQISLVDKPKNVNIAVIPNKEIIQVHKGTADELNNAVFETYDLHKQYNEILVDRPTQRNVPLKVARCYRIILTFLSRQPRRLEIKQALKSNFLSKFNLLNELELDLVSDVNKPNIDIKHFRKKVSFQLIQTLALLNGDEIYTKQDAGGYLEILLPTVYTGEKSGSLDVAKDILKDRVLTYFDGNLTSISE